MNKDANEMIKSNNRVPKHDYKYYAHSKRNTGYTMKSIKPDQRIESIKYLYEKNRHLLFLIISYSFYSVEEILESKILQKFLADDPQKISGFPISYFYNELFLKELAESELDETIFDNLPSELRKQENIQKIFKRKTKIYNKYGLDNNGYNREWLNADGNLIEFFKLGGNYQIKSKREYLKLVSLYIKSRMTVHDFCQKYYINDVDGFNKLLDRIGKENDEIENEVNEIKSEKQNLYKKNVYNLIVKIVNDSMSLDEYFDNYYKYTHDIYVFLNFSNMIGKTREFVKKVIDYYDNANLIKNNEMHFLFKDGNVNFKTINTLFNQFRYYLKSPEDNYYVKRIYEIVKNISKYKIQFNELNFPKTSVYKDGKVIEIEKSAIEQAVLYVKDNDIYKSYYSVNCISKDIALDKINYESRYEEKIAELRENILILLGQRKTIDEYIETIEKLSVKNR